jgi:hypothetical protein
MQGVCPLNKGVTMTGFTTSESMDELGRVELGVARKSVPPKRGVRDGPTIARSQ